MGLAAAAFIALLLVSGWQLFSFSLSSSFLMLMRLRPGGGQGFALFAGFGVALAHFGAMFGQKLRNFAGIGERFVDGLALGKQFGIEGTGDDMPADLRLLEGQDEFSIRDGEGLRHDSQLLFQASVIISSSGFFLKRGDGPRRSKKNDDE
jgi:hypothetical protein